MFLGSAALIAGYLTLTAFGGEKMTLAMQTEQIAKDIATKVADLRTQKTAECDALVASEAKAKFDEMMAAAPAPADTKAAPAKKGGKNTKGGPKVDPLPTPAPPAPVDPDKAKKDGKFAPVNPEVDKAKKDAKFTPTTPEAEKAKKDSKFKKGGK